MMLDRIREAIEAGEQARVATGGSRELSLAITKLEEAEMWAERAKRFAEARGDRALATEAFGEGHPTWARARPELHE